MKITPNKPSRQDEFGSVYAVGSGYNDLSIQQNYCKDFLSEDRPRVDNRPYFIRLGGSSTTLTQEEMLEFMGAFLLITDIYDSNKDNKGGTE